MFGRQMDMFDGAAVIGIGQMQAAIAALENVVAEADALGVGLDAARHYCSEVLPHMARVRKHADMLETRVADDLWALPNYQEILFGK